MAYARQWWHARYDLPYGRLTAHLALGNGGQLILIAPEARLVAVVTGGRYDRIADAQRMVLERILPSRGIGRGLRAGEPDTLERPFAGSAGRPP